jgi:hypothetical protein
MALMEKHMQGKMAELKWLAETGLKQWLERKWA